MRVVLDIDVARSDEGEPDREDVRRVVDQVVMPTLLRFPAMTYTAHPVVRLSVEDARVVEVGPPNVKLVEPYIGVDRGRVVLYAEADGEVVPVAVSVDVALGLDTLLASAAELARAWKEAADTHPGDPAAAFASSRCTEAALRFDALRAVVLGND